MSMIDHDSLTTPVAVELTRRGLIKGMGFVAVGITLASCAPSSEPKALVGQNDRDITQVDAWIAIGADETVTLFSSRIDNGHGTMTGLLQIMADELDVPFAKTRAVFGDTALTPDDGGTGAVDGIQLHGKRVRQAAASARAGLLELASRHLKAPVSRLAVNDGVVSVVGQAGKSISYGKLIGGRQLSLKVDEAAPIKSPKDYKVVGKPIPRIDLVKKVTGEAEWVGDIRLPGMLHARVVRTTGWSMGADEILSVDESSVANAPGLVKVVRVDLPGNQNHFVGVICEREEQAAAAAEKLKVTWADAPKLPADLHADLVDRVIKVHNKGKGGDVDAALAKAAKIFEATYKTPSQLHSPIMPALTVADVKVVDGKVESARLWVSAQRVGLMRTAVGRALEIPEAEIPERVRISYVYGAGTFGTGNGNTVNAIDAVMLSKAVNRPVRLQWTREQQHGFDFAFPPQMFMLKAGLGPDNEITAYAFDHYGDDKFIELTPTNADTSYDGAVYAFGSGTANHRLKYNLSKPRLPAAYIRGVGGYTVFPVECFLDEICAFTDEDPLAFRRRHLNFSDAHGYRRKELLDRLAQSFGWEPRTAPRIANAGKTKGVVRGRGFAYSEASFALSYSAAMADVDVDLETGEISVPRVVVAMDAGLTINPILARDQVEGGIVMGVSKALLEEKRIEADRVAKMDWNDYPIIRFDKVPKVDAILIDRPNETPGAFGDTAMDPLFPAIANGVFDATGARVRDLPFTPERVLAALRARRA